MSKPNTVRVLAVCVVALLAGCASSPSKRAGVDDEAAQKEVVAAARMINDGQVMAAMDGPLTEVVNRYEKAYANETRKVYSARGTTQALLYMALYTGESKNTSDRSGAIAIGPAWAMAYWARGYGYAEMARYPEAEAELKKALSLSPMDAQYTMELAYVFQAEHRMDDALELYKTGVGLVPLTDGWDDAMKNEFTCKGWRGQGYVLAEMQRYDEAEQAYRECMKVIPGEPKSQGELGWIAEQRAKQKHS